MYWLPCAKKALIQRALVRKNYSWKHNPKVKREAPYSVAEYQRDLPDAWLSAGRFLRVHPGDRRTTDGIIYYNFLAKPPCGIFPILIDLPHKRRKGSIVYLYRSCLSWFYCPVSSNITALLAGVHKHAWMRRLVSVHRFFAAQWTLTTEYCKPTLPRWRPPQPPLPRFKGEAGSSRTVYGK